MKHSKLVNAMLASAFAFCLLSAGLVYSEASADPPAGGCYACLNEQGRPGDTCVDGPGVAATCDDTVDCILGETNPECS